MPVKTESEIYTDYISMNLDEEMDQWGIQMYELQPVEFLSNIGYDSSSGSYYNNINNISEINNPNITATTTTPNAAALKHQIRNHDCMWSGRCVAHPEKSKCSFTSLRFNNNNINNNNNSHSVNNIQQNTIQSNYNHNINNNSVNNNNNNLSNCNNVTRISSQQIPAGRSLLINQRTNQNNLTNCNNISNNNINNNYNAKCVAKLPNITTADFLKDRDVTTTTLIRPDTPISLDDDPPEFKHSIDLAACTMGSNKMCLVNPEEVSSARIITMLKEHLEDSSNDSSSIQKDLKSFLTNKVDSLSDLLQDLQEITDFEVPEEDESMAEDDSDLESNSGSAYTSSISELSRIPTPQPTTNYQQSSYVDDHCYTRCKTRVNTDPLGVQTPSDSEEEIDVVSVGDKTLPTNPSARDRRALQTTVADKISARMVKTARGIKTIPARRQQSDDDTIMQCSSTTPTKLNSNVSIGSTNFTVQCNDVTTSSRKRPHPSSKEPNGGAGCSAPKRHRGKKQRSPGKRQNSDTDEADTIEKRNLHNDMERQRRIGLKNLFEELKRQIPSLRDKERAPKVSILREAAVLCNKLNRDQDTVNGLKKQQARLLQRIKQLRTQLSAQWQP